MASFTDISNIAPVAINLYQDPVYQKQLKSQPQMKLVPSAEFKNTDGLNPVVVTTTHTLPTSYPTGLSNLTLSNGTGSAACDISATLIRNGYKSRTYALEVAAFESLPLCATDLDFGPNPQAEDKTSVIVANYIAGMYKYLEVFQTDWYRIKNIAMINNKIGCELNGAFNHVSDTNANFSGLSNLPSDILRWNHLDPLYDLSQQTGMSEQSPAQSGGDAAFFLVCGMNAKRRLFQYDQLVRDTVNWQTGNEALQNFKATGIDTTINGFLPIIDNFSIRYAVDGTTPIYPFINQATTSGFEWVPNPDYKPKSQGGSAVYEVFHVLCNNIWERRARSVSPGNVGGASFSPINYTGEINWINNKDMTVNPQGNKGYFRADWQSAAKSIFPEYGFSGLALLEDPT